MTLFMRSQQVHQQPSPTDSTIVWKFPEVIIINYKRLGDKDILKTEFKIRETSFKMSKAILVPVP